MPIKVKDLIAALTQQDPEAILVVASDSEGNEFSTFSGYEKSQCFMENPEESFGSVNVAISAHNTPLPEAIKCIILYPSH